jgi:heat shock protein HtpX
MVLVSVVTPLVALGLLAAAVILVPRHWLFGLIAALVLAPVTIAVRQNRRTRPSGRSLTERDDPELFGILDRLCGLADLPRPEVVLSEQSHLNSWVVHLPGRPPHLHVTRGLRRALTTDELQAVLGHELAHIANRDALVMSVVGGPSRIMLSASTGGGLGSAIVVGIGLLSQLGVTILSRYRELAADAGSCAITGRPSALASALLKVSGSLGQIPREDLRAAAALNVFNLVAVPSSSRLLRESRTLRRITATHPPLQTRLDALEALERAQQHGKA